MIEKRVCFSMCGDGMDGIKKYHGHQRLWNKEGGSDCEATDSRDAWEVQETTRYPIECRYCGSTCHLANECWLKDEEESETCCVQQGTWNQQGASDHKTDSNRDAWEVQETTRYPIECRHCGSTYHLANECWLKDEEESETCCIQQGTWIQQQESDHKTDSNRDVWKELETTRYPIDCRHCGSTCHLENGCWLKDEEESETCCNQQGTWSQQQASDNKTDSNRGTWEERETTENYNISCRHCGSRCHRPEECWLKEEEEEKDNCRNKQVLWNKDWTSDHKSNSTGSLWEEQKTTCYQTECRHCGSSFHRPEECWLREDESLRESPKTYVCQDEVPMCFQITCRICGRTVKDHLGFRNKNRKYRNK